MSKIYFLIPALVFSLLTVHVYSQEDTTFTSDTTSADDSTTVEVDPVKEEVSRIIKEVNRRFMDINNIHSEGEIKMKTRKQDESASIEINVRKKDEVWFKIEGPLGIDVAQGNFGRQRFTFLNDLNDEAVTGSTNVMNIGALLKIRFLFDDMVNVFSGSVRIPKSKRDSLYMEDDGSMYVLSLKRGTVTRRYWVDKTYYNVTKYLYINKKGETSISFDFSNFEQVGDASYAKKIEIRRPKYGEYFSLKVEEFRYNLSNLNMTVSIPSDYKRRNWK